MDERCITKCELAKKRKVEGRFDEAILVLRNTIRHYPGELIPYYNLGKVAYLSNQPSLANQAYLAALHLTFKRSLCIQRSDPKFAQACRELIRKHPDDLILSTSQIHRYAPTLLIPFENCGIESNDILRHLGHVSLDFAQEGIAAGDGTDAYRDYIQYGLASDFDLYENKRCIVAGRQRALEKLRWDKIDDLGEETVGTNYGF